MFADSPWRHSHDRLFDPHHVTQRGNERRSRSMARWRLMSAPIRTVDARRRRTRCGSLSTSPRPPARASAVGREESFQSTAARRVPRSASASSTWRNQRRQPMPNGIPSRRFRDNATSSGDLSCKIGRTDQFASRNTGDQKGIRRHIRGSLMTGSLAWPNSPARTDFAWPFSANAAAAVNTRGIELAPILPMASASRENLESFKTSGPRTSKNLSDCRPRVAAN